MVNICLQHFKQTIQNLPHITVDKLYEDLSFTDEPDIIEMINAEQLLTLIQELPPAYKAVFNLYVFEGLKHREIAEQLGIGEGTSKSNLQDARRLLQRKIARLNQEAKPIR